MRLENALRPERVGIREIYTDDGCSCLRARLAGHRATRRIQTGIGRRKNIFQNNESPNQIRRAR